MLSLPQSTTTSKEGAIDVAETESELAPFLRLLNLSHDEGDPLEDLKVDDWPIVARLADKYDSATEAWLVKLKLHAFERSIVPWQDASFCSTCRNNVQDRVSRWQNALLAAMRDWQASTAGHPFEASIKLWLYASCIKCKEDLAQRYDREYRDTAPEFPL
ncbi:hypothetical protein JCM9279_002957 [Rhodotorula babjevae]